MCQGSGTQMGGTGGGSNSGYSLTGDPTAYNTAFQQNPAPGGAMQGIGGGISPPPGGAMQGISGGINQPSGGAMQGIGGGINQPGRIATDFFNNPQQGFSYAPRMPQVQPRPDWMNGGWNGGGPINPQIPNIQLGSKDIPGSKVPGQPTGNLDYWRNYQQIPGGVYSAPGATFPGGGGINPPPPPGLQTPPVTPPVTPPPVNSLPPTKVPPKAMSADPNAALYQGIAQGNGAGFTPSQINAAGPGGAGYGNFLNYYQQNQAQLNRQGPMYQPGGMFYNPAIDGAK